MWANEMIWGDTGIFIPQTVPVMVAIYENECARIREAYADLELSQKNLESAFGEHYSDFDTLPERVHSNPTEEIIKKLKCNAWRAIIDRLGIRKIMSVKRWDELDKKLHNADQLPDLTVPAISDMMTTLIQNANEFAKEAVLEVFDYLRPREHYSAAQYKTNQKNAKFEIGKNIIMTHMVSNRYGGGFQVIYHEEQKLIAMDKVFHNLDGFQVPDGYKSPLVDAINTCIGGFAETNYFRVKCYQNGNLHVEFKRLDLLTKFNAIAGGANLKG
jgi:hypothetical protein